MPDHTRVRHRKPGRQRVPRIPPQEATRIFQQCEQFLANSLNLLGNLRATGFGHLLAQMDEEVLRLAVQPDSWGEGTRARLMSDLAPALCATLSAGSALYIEDVVRVTNAVTPCLLLELGRRKGHIQVEFPRNPSEHSACFGLSVSPSGPMRSVTTHRLLRIVDQAGHALVGLCYFGDNQSRDIVEAQLIDSAHA